MFQILVEDDEQNNLESVVIVIVGISADLNCKSCKVVLEKPWFDQTDYVSKRIVMVNQMVHVKRDGLIGKVTQEESNY